RGLRTFAADLVSGLKSFGGHVRALWRRDRSAASAWQPEQVAEPVDTSVADIFSLGHDGRPAYVEGADLAPVVERALSAVGRRVGGLGSGEEGVPEQRDGTQVPAHRGAPGVPQRLSVLPGPRGAREQESSRRAAS